MHKTVKKGGSWKSAIKRRRTRKKISNISEKINILRKEARDIENVLTQNTANTARKKELKRKQGVLLRKMEVLKNSLKVEQKWEKMQTIDNKEKCEKENSGIYKDNKCYIKQAPGTTCSKKIYKNTYSERNQPYCLVDELLSSMEDSNSMIFTGLINETRSLQPNIKKSRLINVKPIPPRIPVLIRLQTNVTGHRYKFVYSSNLGSVIGDPKKKPVPATTNWVKIGTRYNSFESSRYIQNQYRRVRRPIVQNTNDYPTIGYQSQDGGPYAKFRALGGSVWPKMPTWDKINQELVSLLQQLFSKNKIISIPGATGKKGKEKKFLINNFTWLPLEFDDPYLQEYEPIKQYFEDINYKFIIIPYSGTLVVVLDVKLNGKIISREDAKIKMKKIQEAELKEKEKLAKMTPEQRDAYKNSILNRLDSANTYLTSGCNNHLEAIKNILRSFRDDGGKMTSYDDTKNTELRAKFMTSSENMRQDPQPLQGGKLSFSNSHAKSSKHKKTGRKTRKRR
jgi:hypothetical protein